MALADLLYPQSCCGCGSRARGGLCLACLDDSRKIVPSCPRCGSESGSPTRAGRCAECVNARFDRAFQAVRFEGVVRKAIHRLKYRGELGVANVLSKAALSSAPRWARTVDIVTWVPSSQSRVRDRGFDHAALLAQAVAQELGIDSISLLAKVIETPQQMRLPSSERRHRIKGSMRAALPSPDRVLLVDDVMTTGTSASEAARALKLGGAERVDVVCIARSWNP